MQTASLIAEIESNLSSGSTEGVLLAIQATFDLLQIPGSLNRHAANVIYAAAIAAESLPGLNEPLQIYDAITSLPNASDQLKAMAWYRLAVCFDRLGNWGKSMASLKQALAGADDHQYIRQAASYRLGLLLSAAEEFDQAIDQLGTVLLVDDHPELDPLRAQLEHASCLMRVGRLEEAEDRLKTVLTRCPEDSAMGVQARLLLVDIYRNSGDLAAIQAPLLELATTSAADPQFRAMAYSRLMTLNRLPLRKISQS